MSSSRRTWIKQAGFSIAALGLGESLYAEPQMTRKHADRLILLNSNENAFGPSRKTLQAITAAASRSNRYPDDEIQVLIRKLAAHHKIGTENITMTAGSTEILSMVATLAAKQKGNAVTAEPSFNFWTKIASGFGLSITRVPVNAERKLDLDKMRAAVNSDTRMVYVCNPNNPVGNYIEHEKLKAFVEDCSKTSLVLVDEAYTEFAGIPSLTPLALNNKNIIIAKTFSKIYALAGSRVGYAIAHPDAIARLNELNPWPNGSISQVSVAAASAALDDQEFVAYCAARTAEAREKVYSTLKGLKLEYIPSYTSFMLFNIDPIQCNYEDAMRKKNIMVQYRNHFGGKWCRVSMGTLEEMDRFCKSLKEICS
ncbi:MAG TPA: histidinol-phosphate transaminase [Chitinophagaceae bacterium]|nr:histidinol-phosphate transaminase [Chitinophagaceae bacterium]